MKIPSIPDNENQRIKAVRKYKLLDTLPEEDFDNITNLLSAICNVPISLITLLDSDRNFLKSHHGVDISESPRSISFCGHAINQEADIFIVEDARKDERFHDNPLVEEFKAIFYAGVPLKNPDGYPLGTLCVYDHKPRVLTDFQKQALRTLGKQVINLFELRLKNLQLSGKQKELERRNTELKSFAAQVSHDLKSPLANIMSLIGFLQQDEDTNLSDEAKEYTIYIKESASELKNYIDGLLSHYRSEAISSRSDNSLNLKEFFESIKQILNLSEKNFIYPQEGVVYSVSEPILKQVFFNLIDNAFKYNDSASPLVVVDYEESDKYHVFSVQDNGKGIPAEKQKKIFDLFNNAESLDKDGKKGTGIGLYTVKTLVEKLEGTLSVESEIGKGTTFIIKLEI